MTTILPTRVARRLTRALERANLGPSGDKHHFHYAPKLTPADPEAFAKQLQAHSADLIAMVRNAARNGHLST